MKTKSIDRSIILQPGTESRGHDGGKGGAGVAQWLICEMPPHRWYYEPFLGAGAVFIQLQPQIPALSDTNSELIHFLDVVRLRPQQVVRAVWRWSNTAACYAHVRKSRPKSDVGRAARFLYLNRTCWGGIYRTNKEGEFNVPFGHSNRSLCSMHDVTEVSTVFARARLKVQDFETAIQTATKGDAIYADPPYTGKGENNGFIRYNEKLFSWNDQMRLARACRTAKRRGAFVAVSGLWHREVLGLYRNWWALKMHRCLNVSRQAAFRRQICEAVIFSRKPKAMPKEFCRELGRLCFNGSRDSMC